jgi:hypothetical protein
MILSIKFYTTMNNTKYTQHILSKQNPEEIEWIEKIVNDLSEKWPSDIEFPIIFFIEKLAPHLFLDAFPSLKVETIRPLTVAGQILGTSIVMCDSIIDRENDVFLTTKYGFSFQVMLLEAYNILYSIFPNKSKFWEFFRKYYYEYIDACITEKKFASGELPFSEYTEELALQIAANKSAIAKVNIAGLVELAKDDSLFEPLTEAVKRYLIARQIWDDISDWKEDLQSGTPPMLGN